MIHRITTRHFLCLTAAFVIVAGCSSSSDPTGNRPPSADVRIVSGASAKGFQAYAPDTLTVQLSGAPSVTVVWRNDESSQSSILHTVTDTAAVPAFSTGNLPPGATDSITFTTAGSYGYMCLNHQSMRGLVVVDP